METMEQQDPGYKWIALTNTTLGALMATIDASIVLIALPAIFNGIGVQPLAPSESNYFLWMLLGYMVVTATLLVTFGRISDMFGRVKMYNAGFAVFTIGSILLSITHGTGDAAALQLVLFRLIQGVGAGFLFANSTAILTDAFPAEQRGTAMGINQIAAIAGSFIGLILGGILAAIDWRLVFLVSVPVGIAGTIWAYLKLKETAIIRAHQQIDWIGNVTFAAGLTIFLVGITYSIEPYGSAAMGWGNPLVIGAIVIGLVLLAAFVWIELHVPDPMFRVDLFKIRMFTVGNLSGFLAALARGGLQFMLVIWLQGIWLPLHGYSYEVTPLWAGIYMTPLLVGFIVMGPVSGWLSDRFGARLFATVGMLLQSVGFLGLTFLPPDFNYTVFAGLLLVLGIGSGMFAAPNTTAIMNSVPPETRGVASGMRATFQNAASLVSIGLFFSIVVAVLASALPTTMYSGLTQYGVPSDVATSIAHLPPTSALFGAFLGYNPIGVLLPQTVQQQLPQASLNVLLSKTFFPNLIAQPFMSGLRAVFYLSAVMCFIAALASLMRGERVIYAAQAEPDRVPPASPARTPSMPATPATTTTSATLLPSGAMPAPLHGDGHLTGDEGEPAAHAGVITVSRQYGSGGGQIADLAAKRLGWDLLDEDLVERVARSLGVSETEVLARDERLGAFPARLLARARVLAPELLLDGRSVEQLDEDRFHVAVQNVIEAAARLGHVVIVGRGGQVILGQRPDTLHVRVVAPLEKRMEYVAYRDGLSRAGARARVMSFDHARERYMQGVHGRNVNDPLLYDVILNTGDLDVDAAVEQVCSAMEHKRRRSRESLSAEDRAHRPGQPADLPTRPPQGASRGAVSPRPETSPWGPMGCSGPPPGGPS